MTADIKTIAAAALPQAEIILNHYLPGGKLSGREYQCGDLSGGNGDSFSFNTSNGMWADFATGEKGGDFVSLIAAIRKCSQPEAAKELAAFIGHTSTSTAPPKATTKETWKPVVPVPADAPAPPAEHYKHGAPAKIHIYESRTGQLMQIIHRYELQSAIEGKKPDKQFSPLTFCRNESGRTEWRWQALPESRPLFGLELLSDTDKIALIVEGEKATEAARRIVGGKIKVLTWSGGGNAVSKTDWTPVKDKRLCIWPDADKAGHKAALAVADAAAKAGASSVQIVTPPADVCDGFDLADAEAAGWSIEQVSPYLKNSVSPEEFRRYLEPAAEPVQDDFQEQPEPEQADHAGKSFPVVPFPFEVLPAKIQQLVGEYSKALQCPPKFMAMNFLTVASGAIGNSVTLLIKRGWATACFIWFALIDRSGGGKTHPQDAAMKPLLRRQSIEAVKFEKEQAQYRADKSVYDRNKGAGGEPPSEPPPMRHYYTSNFTIESLIPMYRRSSRGLVVHVDELAGLLKSLGQYKGGKNSDDEQLLSLFNCNALKSDRVSKSGFCMESGAAVLGGIQPEVYASVFGDKEAANGMLYRFLPMVLNSSPPMFTDDELSYESEEKWENLIDWLYTIPALVNCDTGCIAKNTLQVTAEGKLLWKKFHNELSTIQPFMPKRFAGYLPKLITYSLKFMTVLHILECYERNGLGLTVNEDTVSGAIKLTRYFAGQALQLMSTATVESNPYLNVLSKAVESLRSEAEHGRLLLSRIRERMNEMLPPGMQIEPTQNKLLSSWLKDIGLSVFPGTGNKSYVLIL